MNSRHLGNRFGFVEALFVVSALVLVGCGSSDSGTKNSSPDGAGGSGKADGATGGADATNTDASVADVHSPPDAQPQIDAPVVADAPVIDARRDGGVAPAAEAGAIDAKGPAALDGALRDTAVADASRACQQAAGSGTNLLINGSFEEREVTAADNCLGYTWCVRGFDSTPGWTQILDGVDLVHNKYVQPSPETEVMVHASDCSQYLDMNQAATLGGIEQVVAATPGATYELTLDTCAWAKNSVPGTLGYELYDPTSSVSLASGSVTDSAGGTWMTRSLRATATSSRIGVRIQGLAAHQAGMGLDNVHLVVVNAASAP